jgi:hypothetical protein
MGAVAFMMGRQSGQGEEAEAASDLLPTSTPRVDLALAGDEPAHAVQEQQHADDDLPDIDTSEPGWDVPYWEEWRAKPRYDQVINGIAVGPTVERTDLICGPDADWRVVEPGAERGTDLEIDPSYLPAGAHVLDRPLDDFAFMTCDGQIASTGLSVGVAAEPGAAARLAEGDSWFAVRTGGVINVHKRLYQPGATPGEFTDIPAEHWYAETVAGLPAAVGRPILDAGLGSGAVLVWDQDIGVLTTVWASDLSLDELLKVAEGVAGWPP